ncbi:conserved hypothetical protein [Capnocytophaga canimorsus]|uniref:Uncharacterized protein n=1 Tax=Capnocytophaga canimorsus TaxID=28188 RepID=A0A0B7IJ97_9FLAO|nr:conserved hypothetical protein [Capnocytophaga canimorsus]
MFVCGLNYNPIKIVFRAFDLVFGLKQKNPHIFFVLLLRLMLKNNFKKHIFQYDKPVQNALARAS